jgi:hypothetical protein
LAQRIHDPELADNALWQGDSTIGRARKSALINQNGEPRFGSGRTPVNDYAQRFSPQPVKRARERVVSCDSERQGSTGAKLRRAFEIMVFGAIGTTSELAAISGRTSCARLGSIC